MREIFGNIKGLESVCYQELKGEICKKLKKQ
jgi:hypothetical protein